MTKMRNVGTVEATEVLFGDDIYQRQQDVAVNYRGAVIWLIGTKEAWVSVGEAKQSKLEAEWQAIVNPAPAPWTDEEKQDALCEQMASDDYENTFYA